MALKLTTQKTTTETLAHGATVPDVTTLNETTLSGTGTVQITRSAIYIRDGYGETNRQSFRYWSDAREVENAVVDFVAALHDGLSSDSEHTRNSCRELLDRILGAAGKEL